MPHEKSEMIICMLQRGMNRSGKHHYQLVAANAVLNENGSDCCNINQEICARLPHLALICAHEFCTLV